MKQLKLMKTLLVAVGLLLGTNAWAYLTSMTGVLGNTDYSASYWVYKSKQLTLADGDQYVLTFVNYNGKSDTYSHQNWYFELNAGSEFADFPIDGGDPWGGASFTAKTSSTKYTDKFSSIAEWNEAYNAAVITLTISRTGNVITAAHTATCNDESNTVYAGTFTSTYIGSDDVNACIVAAGGTYQVINSVEYTPAGGSAITYNNAYQKTSTADWSNSDIVTSATTGKWQTSTSGNANRGLFIVDGMGLKTQTRGKENDTGTLTLDHTANTIVTLDALWNIGDNNYNGGHANGEHYSIFQYGDLLITVNQDDRYTKYYYTINGVQKTMSNTTNGSLINADLTIHLVVNSSSREITEFYIKKGETVLAQFSDLDETNNVFAAGTNYNNIVTKALGGASSTNVYNYLKTIKVEEQTQSVETATITFKFTDTSDEDLSAYRADEYIYDVAVGTTISDLIVSPYTDTFYNGEDNKFVYASDYVVTGNYTEVQSGGTTVTLKFTNYPATAYTVKAQVSGSDLTTLAYGTAYLDGSTTKYWSKFQKIDDAWYETNVYGLAITSATNNIDFTATDAINYFFECEDMTYSNSYSSYAGTSASNGAAKTLGANGANAYTTTTVAAGVYTIGVYGIKWGNESDSYTISYSTDQSNWIALGNIEYSASEEGLKTITNVIIPTASYIRIITNGGAKTPRRYLDYMTFQKTADLPNNVSKTITSAGWATYCSPYVLDFSSSIDNLTAAYLVTGGEEGVLTLSEITGKVPARTGILLKGSGDCTIPVATSSDVSTTDNKLEGVISETPGVAAGIYVLMNINSKVGFYQTENAFTVGANTAYLPSNFAGSGSGDARAFYLFDEDATGINAVSTTKAETGDYYNLAGQRVAQPTKGLYIVNGKKYVVK